MDKLDGIFRSPGAGRSSQTKSTAPGSVHGAVMPLMLALWLAGGSAANAVDLSGAWASAPGACTQIFQKKGARLALTSRANTSGAGFVIDGNSIRGKVANCKIKTRKEEGDLVRLIANCATDVMLSDVEVTLKVIDNNKIARVFAGMPEMETPYYRCPR
jgi:hypothetical protein